MTRKRFVRLVRALNTQMRQLGYRSEKLETIVNELHHARGYGDNYQVIWTRIRKNAWKTYVESGDNIPLRKLKAAIFYDIFFIEN